jgi:uncharacterized protein (TIGR00269 family)
MSGKNVLRCSVCGGPAVTVVRYAKLRLCREHFIEFIQGRVLRCIERYGLIEGGWRVLVAVSGGKDSTALLHILSVISRRLGFNVLALHLDLGIPDYSRKAREVVESFCRGLEVPLIVVDLKELLGVGLPELVVRGRRPACSLCGLLKRYLINVVGVEARANVVALGHHLDDLLTYVMKNFLLQKLNEISKLGPKTESEGPLIGRVRPLYEISEGETALYVSIQGLPVVDTVCPYKVVGSIEGEVRKFLDSIEGRNPGTKIALARGIAKNIESYRVRSESNVGTCRYCGMPTSDDVCAFCKFTEKVLGSPMGPVVRGKIKEVLNRQQL